MGATTAETMRAIGMNTTRTNINVTGNGGGTVSNRKMIDLLKRAKDKLITKGWCQGEMAVDESGEPVPVLSHKACAYCFEGSLRASSRDDELVLDTVRYVRRVLYIPLWNIASWNDHNDRTIEHVIAAIDKAIEQLKSEGRSEAGK